LLIASLFAPVRFLRSSITKPRYVAILIPPIKV
jgi:hypothetical protein